MIIKDEAMLKRFRGIGRCQLCNFPCAAREPHHLIRRGFGGGTRFDVAINLISLGVAFQCRCHRLISDEEIDREDVLTAVAMREETTLEAIEEAMRFIRGLPKHPMRADFRGELSPEGLRLVHKTFAEWPGSELWMTELLQERIG